ncbi:helix-turn-helix domain [Holotrichia oblita]|uniref:Helix-turn-helix domain n=1 Tax=Holotrichia oblita TaxID=644536 RepID=A0ACB9TRV0_HOLOL|nr:helix-turn-helix domain [Holotrichia oblita]
MDLFLTDTVRAVALIQDGRSQYYVARVLGVSRCNVQRAVKRFNEFGVYTRRNHCGRKKSTSERDNRFITLNVLRDRKVTFVQMKNRFENVRQVQVLLRFFFSFQIPGPCRYIPDTTIRYNSLRAPGQTNTSSEQVTDISPDSEADWNNSPEIPKNTEYLPVHRCYAHRHTAHSPPIRA